MERCLVSWQLGQSATHRNYTLKGLPLRALVVTILIRPIMRRERANVARGRLEKPAGNIRNSFHLFRDGTAKCPSSE